MIQVIFTEARVVSTGMFRVTIVFESPQLIESLRVYDLGGVELPVEQPDGCPDRWTVVTPPIRESQLPLSADGTECDGRGSSRDEIGPIWATPRDPFPGSMGPGGCSPTRCPDFPSDACLDAIATIREAVAAMQPGCLECAQLDREAQEWRRQAEAYLVGFFVAAALGALLGSVLPWPANLIVGAIFAAGAAVLLGLFFWAGSKEKELGEAAERCRDALSDQREAVEDAIAAAAVPCCNCFAYPAQPPC